MRHEVAGGDQFIKLGLLFQRGDALRLGTDLGTQLIRSGRQVEAVGPGDALGGQIEDVGGRLVAAEHRLHGQRTPQVQMRVVLPGEADAAMHLDVEFGVADVGRKRQCRCGGGDQPELLLVLAGRAGGVPDAGDRRLGGHQHVGAVVLDGLEGGDGAAELLADLRVLDSAVDAVRRTADGLGGIEGAGAGQGGVARAGEQVVADLDVGQRDPPGAPGPVQVFRHLDRDPAGCAIHQDHVLAAGQEQNVGKSRTDHHAGVTGEAAP